ncbi:hypothetical protein Pcinc_035306 [Petrolisthes cinctipes]|uniref:Uncharacterized protein n=1 Tax=Petrolisthes cinctipes TaxID=88211 RepID=A0AAE1BX48_PETCI|nr:hypothetical protein Pcinc_035306 [Petrolisthes cinctipes]
MADSNYLKNAVTIRSFTSNDVDRLKNAQLKQTLATLINETKETEPSNTVLFAELQSMKQSLRELTTTKQHLANLSERMNDAYIIVHQQQLFQVALDNKDCKVEPYLDWSLRIS